MIPQDFITEWRAHAPWVQDVQVEQDLVISRALVEMFRVPELADALAFRGGTALYKLHLHPPARYSEDIDLVQVRSEPIGGTLDRLKAVLEDEPLRRRMSAAAREAALAKYEQGAVWAAVERTFKRAAEGRSS